MSDGRHAGADGGDLLGRIDHELQAALDIAPSPQFLPGVRGRLAHSAPSGWRGRRQWLPALAAAALVTTGAVLILRPPAPAPRRAVERGAITHAGTDTAAVAPPAAPSVRRASSPRALAPPSSVATAPTEVLVPRGQEALLRRLVHGMALSHPPSAWRLAAEAAPDDPVETIALDLPPMDVQPLAIAPLSEE